jgi:hypothetical protein
MSFADYKKKSKLGSLTEKLVEKFNKMDEGSSREEDTRIWTPKMGKSGTGEATVRFLPGGGGHDEDAYVEVYSHAFKGSTGKWLIEGCPTTIEETCPICDENRKLWAEGKEGIVRGDDDSPGRKRKLSYYSNVYIIDDPVNPDNNGKVKIYKYGVKILDKIKLAQNPTSKRKKALDVFDMFKGADFNIVINKKMKYWNYDDSEFLDSEPLLDGDEDKLEEIYNSLYDLTEFTNPKNFKSSEELKARLNLISGYGPNSSTKKPDPELESEMDEDYSNVKSKTASILSNDDDDDDDEDNEDYLARFSKLAEM